MQRGTAWRRLPCRLTLRDERRLATLQGFRTSARRQPSSLGTQVYGGHARLLIHLDQPGLISWREMRRLFLLETAASRLFFCSAWTFWTFRALAVLRMFARREKLSVARNLPVHPRSSPSPSSVQPSFCSTTRPSSEL